MKRMCKIVSVFIVLSLMSFLMYVSFVPVSAGNYGSSTENDSTVVTYIHKTNADSAHCSFAFGQGDPYDSVFMYPVAGVTNTKLIADAKLDLDSIGAHHVMITVFDDDVIIDTVYGVWMHTDDKIRTGMMNQMVAFTGACDSCYIREYPEGGNPNKDSIIVINPALGDDSLVGKVLFLHGTIPGVYDTAFFYYAPWW